MFAGHHSGATVRLRHEESAFRGGFSKFQGFASQPLSEGTGIIERNM